MPRDANRGRLRLDKMSFIPGIEVVHPVLYLVFGDCVWIVDEACEDSCFVDTGVPEFTGEHQMPPAP